MPTARATANNAGQPGSPTGTSADAQRMAGAMSEALLAFARSGDPNHAGLPHWPQYEPDRRATMLFDAHSTLADDPRVLTQRSVADAFGIAAGLIHRDLDAPPSVQ